MRASLGLKQGAELVAIVAGSYGSEIVGIITVNQGLDERSTIWPDKPLSLP